MLPSSWNVRVSWTRYLFVHRKSRCGVGLVDQYLPCQPNARPKPQTHRHTHFPRNDGAWDRNQIKKRHDARLGVKHDRDGIWYGLVVALSAANMHARRDGQTGRLARPGLGPVKPDPFWARLENRTGLPKHAGSICYLSPARSGSKRVGSARLARKKWAKKRFIRVGKHVLV